MSKPGLDLGDFAMAPRRRPPGDATSNSAAPDAAPEVETSDTTGPAESAPTVLPRLPADERRRAAENRAIGREDARLRLSDLSRARQRSIKFYVNVALDYSTKARLVRAATENDVKMTTIMTAAIDAYLTDNGY
ncbi:hypothetical protein [Rhizobium tumorigenes]|uniref:Uncharacterized protein n=1 Tax=Rhizobium tumorigenes TaxID=2041385 RepID=A0AAF1K828_9HYPH|nr:hypothetical protein [Rhizobium tumorigenes]WFR97792.1 hypothetical protein PR017_17925 [Rhizobium tumorigenes]